LSAVGIIYPSLITFQITQDATGNRGFTWPSNTSGGAPIGPYPNSVTQQTFLWNGTSGTAVGPATVTSGVGVFNALAYNIIGGGYQISGSYGALGQCLQSTSTGTIFALCDYVLDSDPTVVTVGPFTSTPLVMNTTSFPAGMLNYVGAAFRLTSQVDVTDGTASTGAVYFAEGTSATLSNPVTAEIWSTNASSGYSAAAVTCMVKTAGATGSMICNVLGGNFQQLSQETTITGIDFTSPVFVGNTCQLGPGAGNSCTQKMLLLERLH
jgi:hypothetical protein